MRLQFYFVLTEDYHGSARPQTQLRVTLCSSKRPKLPLEHRVLSSGIEDFISLFLTAGNNRQSDCVVVTSAMS